MNYKAMLNAHAFNVLTKRPQVPDYHLMVGHAEDLTSQPILIAKDYVPSEVIDQLNEFNGFSNEELADMIKNNVIEVNDLNAGTSGIGAGIWEV